MPLALSRDIANLVDESEQRDVVLLDSEQDNIPFDRIQCPDLRAIGESWLAMPRETGQPLPEWKSFRPFDFKRSVEKMCVLSVEDWRADKLEFSLYGSHPTEFIGLGRPLSMEQLRTDTLRRGYYEDIRDRVGRAVDKNAPQYARKTLSWNDHGRVEYEVLMLPFTRQERVQRVLQPVSATVELTESS